MMSYDIMEEASFYLHQPFLHTLSLSFSTYSGIQRDLLHQLFLPVFWKQ